MKKVRLFCLALTVALVLLNPLQSFGGACCSAFNNHCSDWCTLNGHGQMLVTDCYGLSCSETCFCYDEAWHEHSGGTYCSPCGG
jgi:hypothetical protein